MRWAQNSSSSSSSLRTQYTFPNMSTPPWVGFVSCRPGDQARRSSGSSYSKRFSSSSHNMGSLDAMWNHIRPCLSLRCCCQALLTGTFKSTMRQGRCCTSSGCWGQL